MNWNELEWMHPGFLWLLLCIPLLIFWYWYSDKKSKASFTIASTKGFSGGSLLSRLRVLLPLLRLLAVASLIIALARPRDVEVSTKTKVNKGIDIVMAMDVSGSMLAKDLKPNRLEALKKVATNFLDQRPNDRIGVVAYAGESYTKTPITSDKRVVKQSIMDMEWGLIEDGTAIGMGLGTAVNRLRESKAKSKVIILLTDGVNNSGNIDPKTATELATELGIKVYTIGIGTNGMALFPFSRLSNGQFQYRRSKVEIDESLLRYIAKETEGKYFRATSNSKLAEIYEEINALEKTEIEEFKYYNYQELYRPFVLFALGLLLLEYLLRNTIFRSFI